MLVKNVYDILQLSNFIDCTVCLGNSMNCPNCGKQLKTTSYLSLKIEECNNCGGMWFDRDELRRAKDNQDADLQWLDFELFEDKNEKYVKISSKKLCPKDNAKLVSKTYAESKVKIDVCEKCQGVWLDKSEFAKIIKYLENIVTSKSAKSYAEETIKEFEEIFTGPESRISEIKDFIAVVKFFQLRLAVENPWTTQVSQAVNTAGLSIGI